MSKVISIVVLTWLAASSNTCLAQKPVASWESIQQELVKGKPYTLVLLLRGQGIEDSDSVSAQQNQIKHLQHLFTLYREGRLAVFGPLADNTELRGICIFNSADMKEVKAWMEEDPHVQSGQLRYEIHPWFSIPGQKLPD